MSKESSSQEEHKAKMQELKAKQREKRIAARDPDRGLVLMLTGNGKGKSSSAFGMVARALGWGQRVAIVQFIKGKWKTGEREFFARFPEEVTWHTMGEGFTWDTQDRERDIAAAEAALARGEALMASGDYALVVLDEINITLRYDYLSAERVRDAVDGRAANTAVVLTGRDGPPLLCEYADLVSEVTEIKHPYHAGIRAQQGIDF